MSDKRTDMTAPSHAAEARRLVARGQRAALATVARDPAGHPFATLVAYALDDDGRPLLCLSRLAEHTQNLLVDDRASLLVSDDAQPGTDPLALGRATLVGRVVRVPDGERDAARRDFLAAHPEASTYVDFADFALYRLAVESVRWVGGFGRMSWIDAAAFHAAR